MRHLHIIPSADAHPDHSQAVSDVIFLDDNGNPVDLGESNSMPAATLSEPGAVKKAASIADAAGETPTAAEYNGLLAALRAAGIMD